MLLGDAAGEAKGRLCTGAAGCYHDARVDSVSPRAGHGCAVASAGGRGIIEPLALPNRWMREDEPLGAGRERRMKADIASDDLDADRLVDVSPGQRHDMIAAAAYLLAERRGFSPGRELEDWFEAAAVIDQMLANMSRAGVTRADYERAGLRNALRLWVD
jgi:hypothetical protein